MSLRPMLPPLWTRWVEVTTLAHVSGAVFWLWPAAWMMRGRDALGGPSTTLAVFALTMTGAAAHGAVLGAAQGRVLRDHLAIRARTWTLVTAVGAVGGWATLTAFAPHGGGDFGVATDTVGLAIGGLAFGALVGGAQWTALASDGVALSPWLAANAIAWAISFGITAWVLRTTIGAGPAFFAAIGVAGLTSGALVGTITGVVLGRLLR